MPGPSATTSRFARAALVGARLHYLLDVTFGGRVFRLSHATVAVPSTELDADLAYEGILEDEIEWEESIQLFSDSAEISSIPLAAVLPAKVAQMVAAGHDLAAASADLAVWIEGTNYEDRRVLLRGRFVDPEYGADDEPVHVSIESNPFDDAGSILHAGHVVTTTTWPSARGDAVGRAYPFVFGANPSSGPGETSISPGLVIDLGNEYVLIAGHRVAATTVRVGNGTTTATLAVAVATDALGVTISYVDLTSAVWTHDVDVDEFWVDWSVGGGGYVNDAGVVLEGAGDVLQHFLRMSTLAYDRGRVAAVQDELNAYTLCGRVEENGAPWEWIAANLLPILPISIVVGADGLYPVLWRYGATARDAVDHINVDADPTIEREGRVQYEGGGRELRNEFRLSYAIAGRSGNARATLVLGAERDVDDPYSTQSLFCALSKARYGTRVSSEETTVVYHGAAAGRIVAWWARAKALPSRVVTYLVGHDRAWLERGNVVLLTDSSLYFGEHVSLVEALVLRMDGTLRLALRIHEDPARKFKRESD